MTIDQQISSIKARIDSARLAKARSDVARESADAQYEKDMAELGEVFGVDSVANARDTMVKLQDDLTAKLAEIEQILETHKL